MSGKRLRGNHGTASAREGQSGFTLIEIMLALALTTLLMGLLSSGVFIIAEDWNRNSDRLDQELDEALAILQIDRALQGAFPHSYTNEESLSRQLYFSGSDDRLRWVSTVSPQRAPGLTTWELYSVAGEGVYLRLAPAFSDHPGARLELSESQLILPAYSVSFRYLYAELDENKEWRDEWEGEEIASLPLAVYARFEPQQRARGVASELLEIVAPVKANQHRSIRANTGFQIGL